MKYKFQFLLLVLGNAFVFPACNLVKPVQITNISNFKSNNTLVDPEIFFDIGIQNPNNFGVTIPRLEVGLYNGETILSGIDLKEKSKVLAKQTVSIPVRMKPSLESINSLLKSEMNNLLKGKINQKLEIRGMVVLRKFIFTKKIKIKEVVKL